MEELMELVRELLHAVTGAVFYFRRQNYAKGYHYSKCIIQLGEAYFEKAVAVGFQDSVELLLPIWKSLLEATEDRDEVKLADIYEQQLTQALYEIQSCLVGNFSGEPRSYWEQNMELLKKKDFALYKVLDRAKESQDREYAFFWAATGDPVLCVGTQKGSVQLNTAVNPWQEALCYVEQNICVGCRKYLVIGFGMGYHIEAMVNNVACQEITVLENDLEQLRIAFMYCDLSKILESKKVSIIYVSETAEYGRRLGEVSEDMTCMLWYPSVKTIADGKLREALEDYWVSSNSMKNLGLLLEDNFEKNIAFQDENVDVLQKQFRGKTMVLVAAGPSLDDNLEQLKKLQSKEEVQIVCVGKVAAKLVKQGICPDFVVMIDAQLGTVWQIAGLEEKNIPLIYLSTVASTVVEQYKGKRYIAFQQDFEPAEQAAKKAGMQQYQTGGSVATFALDMGIRLGCRKIICVGLDLGYVGEDSHAQGVGKKVADTDSLRQVEGVKGGMIYTSKTLDIYRKWIEKRIQRVSEVTLINASGGAKIHGMQELPLEQCD